MISARNSCFYHTQCKENTVITETKENRDFNGNLKHDLCVCVCGKSAGLVNVRAS